MEIAGYEIDLEKSIHTINKKKYKRVLLQIPEGLKIHLTKFIDYIEKQTKAEIILYGDPCFGACDIINDFYKELKIDYSIHVGHTEIPELNKKSSIPIDFLNAYSNLDVSEIIEKAIPSIIGKKIGVITTAQHIHKIDSIVEILKNNSLTPIIGRGNKRISEKGQILGCNFTVAEEINNEVDSFLYIGSGNFHPIGLLLNTKKPLIACDPYTNQVKMKELEELKDMILRQRYGAIARAKDSKMFGILISTKIGQTRTKKASELKKIIAEKNKRSIIISMNHFFPNIIESFRKIDCFISTACPRIAIDDYMQYKTPILTPIELEIVLNLKKWEEYEFDQIIKQN